MKINLFVFIFKNTLKKLPAVYYIFNIAIISISLGFQIGILIVYFIGGKKMQKVPDWLKTTLCMSSKKSLESNKKMNQFRKVPFNRISIKSKGAISSNNPKTKTKPYRNNDRILKQIFQLVKRISQNFDKIQNKNREKEIIGDEWKKVSRRLDLVLFVIHGSIMIIMPTVMFGKFYFMNQSLLNHQELCHCET